MDEKTQHCAHPTCRCVVKEGESFCGDNCRYAPQDEVEIACECGHAECTVFDRKQV